MAHARHQPTSLDTIRIADVLRKHCARSSGDNPHAIYEEGWSDQRIADECDVTFHNVAHLRERLIGKLRAAKPQPPAEAERFVAYNDALMRMSSRLTRLEGWITTNFGPLPNFGE